MNEQQARMLNAKMAHHDVPPRTGGAGFGATGTLRQPEPMTMTAEQRTRLNALLAAAGESFTDWLDRHLGMDEKYSNL